MISNQTIASEAKPHYILYVDLNGTIMAGDSSNNKNVDDAIWQIICENMVSNWPLASELTMTFRQYIEKCLCKETKDISRDELKKRQRALYKEIVSHLRTHSHPLADEVESIFFNMKKKLVDKNTYQDEKGEGCQGNIFPAFYALIHYLEKNKFNYSLVLSTFGNDLDLVVRELEARTELRFPKNTKVHFQNGELIDHLDNHYMSPIEMEAFFKSQKCFAAKHDWPYWNKHGEKHEYGKPFPINLHRAADVTAIFFDDNAVDKRIIAVKPLDNSMPDQEMIQNKLRSSKHIVAVNAFDAILNDQYFVECIQHHHKSTLKNAFSLLGKKRKSEDDQIIRKIERKLT